MLSALYVDDESVLLDLVKLFLERSGDIIVHLADSADNALSILKKTDIDVIISDYDMPEINGIELLKTIRKNGNQTPFIIFTGKGCEEIVIRALDEGADSYIQKTGDPKILTDELRNKINKVIRFKLVEQELKRKSKEWDGIYNDTEIAILILDNLGGILSANRAALKKYEKLESELIGNNVQKLYYESINIVPNDPFERVLQSKTFESDEITSEKLKKTFTISCTPILDEKGRIEKIIHQATDITQKKKAEEELLKYRENLEGLIRERTLELTLAKELAESANRSKSTFLSNMSHELRTPLNAILGYTQILQRYENITEGQKEQLKTMYTSGKHLLSLINDLLDLSKIEAHAIVIEERAFNLMALLKEVYNITRMQAEEKNLSFTFEPRTAIPYCVSGDEGKFRQILLNLLTNAIKYTETGGIIFRVIYNYPNLYNLHCEIIDTGRGIPENKKEDIFKPFTQVGVHGETVEGTGLGLAITKSLVELMHGELLLESEPGKGSKFIIIIEFPPSYILVPKDAETTTIIGYEGERKKILIVDDNISNASFLEDFLRPLGFNILISTNGQDAIDITIREHPDIILLDYIMDGMKGPEVIHEIRKNDEFTDIRIIGISASILGSDHENDFKSLCNGFIAKPVDINLLLNLLGNNLNIIWKKEISENKCSYPDKYQSLLEDSVLPSQDTLKMIELLAKQGNFTRINQILTILEKNKEADASFIQKIRHSCNKFNDDAIVSFIRGLDV
jgi:PAS domain S-box-containing protein